MIRSTAALTGFGMIIGSLVLSACGGQADDGASAEGVASTSAELNAHCPEPVPDPSLTPPAGNRVAFSLDAIGVQIYTCQATATGYGWVFKAPEATLYDRRGHEVVQHYAGPTWEYRDGSKVVGARVAGFTPDPQAIPWLLLSAASHDGDGRMANISYIQRLDTTGGLAPASGCDAEHVNAEARVPYTATYAFWEPGAPPCHCR